MDSTTSATIPSANGSQLASLSNPQVSPPELAVNTVATTANETESTEPSTTQYPATSDTVKWPGWPGYCVFRLIVPVLKVGSIIGRKGELIKKMCEETQARIRVLDGPVGAPDRVVLISGKEELDAPLSSAMSAVMKVFRRVSGLVASEGESEASGPVVAGYCSIRLLVAGTQAIHLIGKQGSTIKLMQESSGASIRVLSENEVQFFASPDERVVEVQGEALKVLKALELVIAYLRKFLVDQTILPLFEKNYNTPMPQDKKIETWVDKSLPHTAPQTGIGSDYPLSAGRDSLFLDRESQLDLQIQASRQSHYGQETSLSGIRSSGIARPGAPIATQVTMQIPLSYAEDIIGIGGANIAYIRRTSGAILTVQESRGLPEEITVEIKGSSSQVQAAQQLIQEFISNHRDPVQNSYGKIDTDLRPSYSQLGNYGSSSLSAQPYGSGGGYGSSGVGGYNSLRL